MNRICTTIEMSIYGFWITGLVLIYLGWSAWRHHFTVGTNACAKIYFKNEGALMRERFILTLQIGRF